MANFFRIGAGGLNWSNVGSWSTTSGGASNGIAQPTSSDNTTFDTNSPTTVTVAGAAACNTLTLNKASLVITLNGGSIVASGLLTFQNTATVNQTTTETITASSGLTVSNNAGGTGKIILTGGTWTGSTPIANSVDLQGNVTIGNVRYGNASATGGKTLTYVSGTITFSGTFTFQGDSTVNTNGIIFGAVTSIGGLTQTVTLTSDMSIGGLFTAAAAFVFNKTASETVTCSAGMAINITVSGTAKFILTGGTWSGSNTTGMANDLDLQGTITVSGNVYYKTGTLTYVSGTITTTSSTLNLTGSCTLNTNGINWVNIICTNTTGQTYTVNSLLTATATLTLGTGAAVTFAGTSGFTVSTLTSAVTAAQTITLKNSVTYTITTALTCFTSRNGSSLLFTSDDATLKAILTLQNPSLCNCLANFTRIDASAGRTINTFNGTVTTCSNVREFHDLQTVVG